MGNMNPVIATKGLMVFNDWTADLGLAEGLGGKEGMVELGVGMVELGVVKFPVVELLKTKLTS
jgi:hypothetical protein